MAATLGASTSMAASELTTGTETLARLLDERSSGLVQAVGSRADEVAATLGQQTAELVQLLDERTHRMRATLGASASAITTELTASTEHLARMLEDRSGSLVNVLASRADEVTVALGQRTTELAGMLDERTHAMTSTLGERIAVVAGDLAARTEELAQLLDDRSNSVLIGLGSRAAAVSNELAARTQELTSLLDEKSSTLAMVLDERTAGFTSEITRMGETIARAVEQRGSTIAETIAANAAAFTRTVSKSGEDLLQALDATGRATVGELASTSEKVKTDVTQLLDRVREANTAMHQVMVAATRNLETLEGTFTERFNAFRDSTERLNERVVNLETMAGGILKDVGVLSQRFQEQGQTIAMTAHSLGETHRQIDDTLDQRRQSLETLSGNISAYASEIDQRFKHFVDVAREMKAMTEEVRTALDSTRAEMKRGVLELPQETKDSAAAMRRVIAEQIKALGDLNEIVSRHGRAVDVVEPARRSAEAVATAGGASRTARYEPAEPPAPARMAAQRAPEPAPRARPGAPRARAPPRRPPTAAAGCRTCWPAPRRRLPRRRRRRRGPAARRGRRTTPSSRSNSLAMDIARMIDHDAAVELWERYKRGERNVFTRRLYTLQGQQRFEEVRRRYRSDNEFRGDGRSLRRGVRAPARPGRAAGRRTGADQDLPHLRHRQGLHHAGPRRRPLRLSGLAGHQ